MTHPSLPPPSSSFKPHRVRRRVRKPHLPRPHRTVPSNLPDHQRLHLLLNTIITRARSNFPQLPESDCVVFDQSAASILRFAQHLSDTIPPQKLPSSADKRLRAREKQLEHIIDHYNEELTAWQRLSADHGTTTTAAARATLPEVDRNINHLASDVADLELRSLRAVQKFIVQSDILNAELKRMQNQTTRTDLKLETLRSSLYQRLKPSSATDPTLDDLVPPPNMVNMAV